MSYNKNPEIKERKKELLDLTICEPHIDIPSKLLRAYMQYLAMMNSKGMQYSMRYIDNDTYRIVRIK